MKNMFIENSSRRSSSRRGSQVFCAVSIGAVALVLYSGTVAADTATGTLPVAATFISACTVSGGTLDFGTINPTATFPGTTSSLITTMCTATTPYTISMDGGVNGSGAYNNRKLKQTSGSATIGYQIFTSSTFATPWGTGFPNGSTVANTGNGNSQTKNVFAALTGDLTTAQPGVYTDLVTITVTY